MDHPLRRWPYLALVCLIAVPAQAGEKDRPDEIRRPSWGKVMGWVLDAATRKPIPGAKVRVEVDGAFPESGKTTDETDAGGQFTAKAPLGQISRKLDWGRLLTMHPVSLVLSPTSAMKKTKILDVTQVNVRVEASGYQPFVGRVRATLVDPADFSITLDDIWLARTGASLVSFTPDNVRLEVIEGLKVEPAIAAPGQKVKISLSTRLPMDRGYKYRAYATSTAIRLVPDEKELKREKGETEPNRVVFSTEVKLPQRSVDRWTEISFFLIRNDTALLRQRDTKVLLQVAETAEERAAAEKVAGGYSRARVGDRDAALRDYEQARKQKTDYPLAHLLYGDLCLQLNRPRDAADAFKHLVTLDPRDYEVARSRYAFALIETGRPLDAMQQLEEAEKTLGKARIPADVALCRARGYAAQGNFDEADKWLAKAGAVLKISDDVLSEINLKRMDLAVKAKPDNSDLRLSYARVLQGARRRDEAVVQIRKAVELDSSQPWPFIDLGTALWELGQREDAVANLEHALALAPENPEALLALGDAYRDLGRYADALTLYRKLTEKQKLNLRARHSYGLMLYATGNVAEARKELFAVITQARDKGDLREEGLLIPGASIYIGPKRRLVSGFSVPEAVADAAILDALQDLEKRPDNPLLWQNIGSALLDLDLPVLAVTALRRSREHGPELPETRFLLAVALRKVGDLDAARAELEAVVSANPLHPRARLELAQLYTDEGRFEAAQAQLIVHSKNYPYERRARPVRSFGG
jgi:tetratricopeptide (TPR) repeat protein